jgi:hypothetical protein
MVYMRTRSAPVSICNLSALRYNVHPFVSGFPWRIEGFHILIARFAGLDLFLDRVDLTTSLHFRDLWV